MFDTVVINNFELKQPKELKAFLKENNVSLPNDFQTKDLINCLCTYQIDKNGQLFEEIYVRTGKKIKREPLPSFNDNRSFLEKLFIKRKYGLLQGLEIDETIPKKKKSKTTSTIAIYSYSEIASRMVEIEYELKIVEGKVKSHKLIKFDLESKADSINRIEEKKKQDKEFDDMLEKRRIFKSKWYYPLVRETYNPFVYFTSLAVRKLCEKITSRINRWHGV